MRAAIYARRSLSQHNVPEEAKSVNRQIEGALAFVAKQGWSIDEDHIYTDDGVSGALFTTRPEFAKMLRDAEAGAFNCVVFYKLDRFGRNGRRTMDALYALDDLSVQVWDYSSGQSVDVGSFAGRLKVTLEGEFAQQYVEAIRATTKDAMHAKARQGDVTGRAPFGYKTIKTPEGRKVFVVNEEEAEIVRHAFALKADGVGDHTIARKLNTSGRCARSYGRSGKPPKWTVTTVRRLWHRGLYRGLFIYGKHRMDYKPKKGGVISRGKHAGLQREKMQVVRPDDQWIRTPAAHLRIVDEEVLARVDARLLAGRERYEAAKDTGKAPHKAHGRYLLSGGMLVCPDCGAHFEARNGTAWGGQGVYVCASRRRNPGTCSNRLVLPIDEMDEIVLHQLEGEILNPRYVDSLLKLVDDAPDETERLTSEKERLQWEVDNLVESVAHGMPADVIAPRVKEAQAKIAKLEVALRRPRPANINRAKLRAALEQKVAEWKETLRSDMRVARLLIRQLIGPITMWQAEPTPEVPEELKKYIGVGLPEHVRPKLHWSQIPGAVPSPEENAPTMVFSWGAELKVPEGELPTLLGPLGRPW